MWKEISSSGGLSAPAPAPAAGAAGRGGGPEMTLEDFLAREDDPRATAVEGNMVVGFPNVTEGVGTAGGGRGGGGGGRGRKRTLMDPADRAAMQRQKRMIKNRESAARSRERKQVGLDSSVGREFDAFIKWVWGCLALHSHEFRT